MPGIIEVSDIGNKDSTSPVRRRTGLDAISAVKMPERLTAAVDAWAEAHQLTRSDAICKLVELALKIAPAEPASAHAITSDATQIEYIAVHEIDALLDPALPADERERRIAASPRGRRSSHMNELTCRSIRGEWLVQLLVLTLAHR